MNIAFHSFATQEKKIERRKKEEQDTEYQAGVGKQRNEQKEK